MRKQLGCFVRFLGLGFFLNVYIFIYLSKENKYLAVFLQIVDIYVVKVFNFIYKSFYYRPIA